LSVFTEPEADFLSGHRLGHLATVSKGGHPHIVPLLFRFNAELETIELGGHGSPLTKRYYRDLMRTGEAAFIVDDVIGRMRVRAIEVRGRAELLPTGGQAVSPDYNPQLVRLWPRHVVAWGIADPDPFIRSSRDVG
jgi:pyridoxamine 5'-phosphate oxidase family protein